MINVVSVAECVVVFDVAWKCKKRSNIYVAEQRLYNIVFHLRVLKASTVIKHGVLGRLQQQGHREGSNETDGSLVGRDSTCHRAIYRAVSN